MAKTSPVATDMFRISVGSPGQAHNAAKRVAKRYRKQGYRAFIKKSGDKWYVYRSGKKK